MKVLMLIISSDSETVYNDHREVWSKYMNSNPQIDCYFMQYRDGPQAVEGNTIWLEGEESIQKIISKTIDCMDYFLTKQSYDFVVRTNLSSVWNFNVLLKYLETLPRDKVYNGFVGNYKNVRYGSGSGYIMTPDICRVLIENRTIAESYPELDDVAVGYTLHKFNINVSSGIRTDSLEYDVNAYHYRCKLTNNKRHTEKDVMLRIVDLISSNV